MRRGYWCAIALAVLLAGSSAEAQAPRCGDCEDVCMWAQEIMSAQVLLALYDILGPFAGDSDTLEQLVDLNMQVWQQTKEAETPCFMAMAAQLDPGDLSRLTALYTAPRRAGSQMRCNVLDAACPIEEASDLKQQACDPLIQTLREHEKVHQETCRRVWAEATRRFPGRGVIEAKRGQWVINFWNDSGRKAVDEIRAYTVQLRMMRDSMRKLATAKGCGVDTESLTPPPSRDFLRRVDEQARLLRDKLKGARENAR